MIDNRTLWAVSISGSIRSIGFGATWPFMAIFFNEDLGVPIIVVGLIFTFSAISSVIFSILGGWIADKFGRRRALMIGGITGVVIYSLISAFIAFHFSLLAIEIAFVLSSVSGSFIFPSSTALVADVTSVAERPIAYGIYRILTNIGWAVGPIMGAYVYNLGVAKIFAIVAAVSLIQFIIIVLFIFDRKTYDNPLKHRVSLITLDRYLILFSLGTFFIMVVATQFSVTLPTYAADHVGIPVSDIGYVFAVNGFVVVLGQYFLSVLFRKFPDIGTMIVGSFFYTVGYLLVGYSGTLLQLMLDMVIITIGEDLVYPTLNTIISKIAPPEKVGRYMGFNSMMNSSARALGPSVGTVFLSIYAFDGPRVWGSIDLFGVTSIIIFLFFGRTIRKMPTRDPTSQAERV
ncbi:MAG: MFS transporter [Thermoplasmataceae archaeon]